MTEGLSRSALLLSIMVPVFLSACADGGGVSGVSQAQYDSVVAQNQQLQAHVRRLQSAVKYTVNSDLLFPSGSYELTEAGKETIAKVAQILAPEQQEKLVVNGYTDNVPIGPGLKREGIPTNLVLSQKRAENVMQFMISQGVNPNLVSAQGFGEADPVASNDTAEGRAQNRRVELTLAGSGT